MERPTYFNRVQKQVLSYILDNLEKQFERTPFNEVLHTISLKKIEENLGIGRHSSWSIVEYILDIEGVSYERKNSGSSGTRFHTTVTRENFKKMKEDARIS